MISIRTAVRTTYHDLAKKQISAVSAGLSYRFLLSLFPMLILAAAIVSCIPIPNLFDRIVNALVVVVPEQEMGLVQSVLKDVMHARHGGLMTFGILGTLWSASGGFLDLIRALNVAYEVPETRPGWKTRLLAIQLTFGTGLLLAVGAMAMFVGPQFGVWIADRIGAGYVFARVWPVLRWILSVGFIMLAIELIFFWAPNVKQRFLASMPGAVMSVIFWIAVSYALGLYFQNFAHFNKTYGALGAVIALMVWLYWSWFVILLGADLNSQLLKARGGQLSLKWPPPQITRSAGARTDL
jgi:membrane protein